MSWLFSRKSSENPPPQAPAVEQPADVRVATRTAFKPFGGWFNFKHSAVVTETGTHSLGNPNTEPAANYPDQQSVQASQAQARNLEREVQQRSVRRPGMLGIIDYFTKGNCQDVVFQSGRASGVDIPPEAVSQRFNENPALYSAIEENMERQRSILKYSENPVTGERMQPSYAQAAVTAFKNAPAAAQAESRRQSANDVSSNKT